MTPLILGLVLSAVGDGSMQARPDTVIPLEAGQELVLETFEGVLVVRGSERSGSIHLEDRTSRGFRARSRGGVLTVSPAEGRDRDRDVVVDIPAGTPLTVRSRRRLDVRVVGARGGLTVQLAGGEVRMSEIGGRVVVDVVEADVTGTRLDGSVRVGTIEGDIVLRELRGPALAVRTVSGNVELREVAARRVELSSVEGDIRWDGEIAPGSELRAVTHDGELTVALPAPANVSVSVSTFDGFFESDYPVTVQRMGSGQPIRFRIGDPEASVVLESFDGDIRILRTR